VLAGAFVYCLYHYLAKSGNLPKSARSDEPNLIYLAVLLISLSAVPVGFQLYFERFHRPKLIVGVERSWWAIFGLCLVLSIGSVYLARHALQLVKSNEHRSEVSDSGIRRVLSGAMRIGIAALALTPCVVFTSAVIPLPVVVLCGAAFHHVDQFGNNYQIGNLIGTSGHWAYLAETKRQIKGKPIYTGHYIAVVPLSAVRLAAITSGNGSECNDLTPPMTLKSGYYVSSKPGDKPNSPHWFILLTTDSNGRRPNLRSCRCKDAVGLDLGSGRTMCAGASGRAVPARRGFGAAHDGPAPATGSLSAALRTAVTITACTWSDSLSREEGLERNGPNSA
jgi:hypothetical protein